MVFYTACVVILPVIFTEVKSNIPSFAAAAESISVSQKTRGKLGLGSSSGFVTDNFGLVGASVLIIATVMLWGNARDPATARNLSNWIVFPKLSASN